VRLVLASRSPRRADLLTSAGYDFAVAPADIDERLLDGETPAAHVRRLALEKSALVARNHQTSIVLGADTVVVIEGMVLGKPADDADAAAMLGRLSGRTHDVLTGVALHTGNDRQCDVESTRVTFRELTAAEVAWYVGSGEPEGKAGAYAIQGLASRFVTRIEGSYTNVVGLPIALVDHLLRKIRVSPS
jgi:septum formation protein